MNCPNCENFLLNPKKCDAPNCDWNWKSSPYEKPIRINQCLKCKQDIAGYSRVLFNKKTNQVRYLCKNCLPYDLKDWKDKMVDDFISTHSEFKTLTGDDHDNYMKMVKNYHKFEPKNKRQESQPEEIRPDFDRQREIRQELEQMKKSKVIKQMEYKTPEEIEAKT